MFTICFICGVICHIAIPGLFDEMESVVGGGSILYLSALAICNLWSLDPCVTTMYPFRILTLAIGLTTFIAIILTTIAFKMRLDLTGQREALFGSLLFLIITIIVCSIVWYFSGRNLVVWFSLQSLCLFVCCLYLMSKLLQFLVYICKRYLNMFSCFLFDSVHPTHERVDLRTYETIHIPFNGLVCQYRQYGYLHSENFRRSKNLLNETNSAGAIIFFFKIINE